VPIYEFECESCGARFERLVPAGTELAACEDCGSELTRRILSAQAATPKLVGSRGDVRRQEASNAKLRETTKAQFKQRRQAARAKRGGGGDG
jgi:putative FmdB family regulatory protein